TAADVIARVRPDAAPAARRLLTRLLEHAEDAEREPVLIHGDANLRNALLQPDGTVALLDLEDLTYGPAAADLGQVLATLIVNRTPHAARALLGGYGDPPDEAALRWYTAASLLARQALPAISRHRPALLNRLRQLLDAGNALLTPTQVLA
ncbi:MAG TPA: phosphotransferase, partial [Solirubrobacter sp.]